ncbi:MAG: GDSL family lipase [Nitrospirae bacterium]|nr:GDSL family lipase [Nitrospirota bacterium]
MQSKDILFLGHSLIEFFDWQKRFPGHRVAGLGVAGETVEGLLGRLGAITRKYRRADLVFIMTGTNNVAMEDFDFIDSYRDIVVSLSEAYPEAVVHVHSILPIMIEWIADEDIRRVNRTIKEMAEDTGAVYIDLYGLFTDARGRAVKEYFLEDGVHLSNEGYSVWTGFIESMVNRQH